MADFSKTFDALKRIDPQAHQIDRVLISKHSKIYFNISNTTWVTPMSGGYRYCHALKDQHLPLAAWATQQHPKRFRVLSYRPKKRLVLMDQQEGVVLKGYAAGKSTVAAAKHLFAIQLSDSCEHLHVPELIRHDSVRAALVLTKSDHHPIRICETSSDTLAMLGGMLAQLQANSTVTENCNPICLAYFDARDELNVLGHWAKRVNEVNLNLPPGWNELAGELESSQQTINEYVYTHRDLHDGQWLFHDNEATLLDFDLLCIASAMLDVANFVAHIHLRFLQRGVVRQQQLDRHILAFLDGYRSHKELNERNLSFYAAASLMRLSLVYIIRPRWRHLAGSLIDIARRYVRSEHTSAQLKGVTT